MDQTSQLILALALMFTMWGMGMTLTIADFRRVFSTPKALILGLINQLILVPLIAFTLLQLFPSDPEIAVGLMILAACPGGPTSNLLSLLAKADVALSVSLTAVNSIVTVFTIPFIVNIGLENFAGEGSEVQVPILKTILTLVIIVIIPMIIGMVIKKKKPNFSLRMEKTVRIVSVVLLALIIVGIVIKEKENILDYFSRAGILAFLLIVLTISVGYITSKLFKLSNNQSTTIALESGIQNATMALTIATTILANTGYAVTPAIYGLLMYFPAGVLVSMHLRRNKTIT